LFEFTSGRSTDNEDAITRFHVPSHLDITPLYKLRTVNDDDKTLQLELVKTATTTVTATTTNNNTLVESTLRKRTTNLRQEQTVSQIQEDDEYENKEDILKKKDPIYWFGVGVRSYVKKAQVEFQQSLKYVTEMANIQLQLLNLEKKLTDIQHQ
jgi:hypothetical protein